MLAGKGIIKREISQVLRASRKSVKFLRPPLGTHRFQRAVVGERSIEGPLRAGSRMRRVVSDNHSTQARWLRECLVPINAPFPTTARWKRRVHRIIAASVR